MPPRSVHRLAFCLIFAGVAVAHAQQGGEAGEGQNSKPSIEVPVLGEITLPRFIANVLGIESEATGAQGGGGPSAPPAVVFEVAEEGPVGESYRFLGRVAPIERVEVRARVSGYIERVAFEGGEIVSQGDLLFAIEPDRYEAAVAAAEAQLASAQAAELETERQLSRQEQLRDSGTVSQAALDDAVAAAEAARAQTGQVEAALQQARLELSYTSIEAAIGGRMSAPYLTRGNFVSPTSEVLAELVQLDPVWGVFSLGETRIAEWRRLGLSDIPSAPAGNADGAPNGSDYRLSLLLPDGSPYETPGEFDFIGNSFDAETGTVEMRVRFPNPDGLLLPNQNVTLRVSEIAPPVLPVVPQAAIQLGRDGRAVWVVREDDTVSRLPVETIEGPDAGTVAITSGLEGGEKVIVRGALRLQEGQTVEPRTAGGNNGAGSESGADSGSDAGAESDGGEGTGNTGQSGSGDDDAQQEPNAGSGEEGDGQADSEGDAG